MTVIPARVFYMPRRTFRFLLIYHVHGVFSHAFFDCGYSVVALTLAMVVNHGDITPAPIIPAPDRVVPPPSNHPCRPTPTSKSPPYAVDTQAMASLIKKIVSGADRIPEGLQRAQATIKGTRRFDRYCRTPFLRHAPDQKVLSLTGDPPPGWTAAGGLGV